VPATSANLGPGYDCFGLALSLHDEVTVQVADAGVDVAVEGEGAGKVRADDRNLVVKTMYTTFDRLGVRPDGLVVRCTNRIPHGRGLGSSAAAIVAGIAAARGLVLGGDERLDSQAMLQLASELEGHPDNVAATIFGGFTISWSAGSEVGAVSIAPHPDVVPIALVPDRELRTATARGVIPDSISHADATANTARAALLVHAISREPDLLMTATQDWLHQRYRRSVMAGSLELVDQLRADGVPAVVSGAGPTVLALLTGEAATEAMREERPGWRVLALSPEASGVQVKLS
jgi:homoserine kinase